MPSEAGSTPVTTSDRLWQKARQALSQKYQEILSAAGDGSPEALIECVQKTMEESKGRSFALPRGRPFFVRDVLEQIVNWTNRYSAVGDSIMQYDPENIALPWAALRLLVQLSMDNLDKYSAVLEGVELIARWLVWGKYWKNLLDEQVFSDHSVVEENFQKLYTQMLTFMAQCLEYVRNQNPRQRLYSLFSTDSEFRANIDEIKQTQEILEKCVANIADAKTLQSNQLLQDLQDPITRVDSVVEGIQDRMIRDEQEKVLDWISTIPYAMHFRDLQKRAMPGTGLWLFQHHTYSNWLDCKRSNVIWLHGDAGSGKTTLMSMIIQSLITKHEAHQTPCPVYFFCSRSTAEAHRSDAEYILRSLLRQLARLPLHSSLCERYHRRSTEGNIAAEEATDLFLEMIADRAETIILIDALDECNAGSRETLMDSLERMLKESKSPIKICFTSRENYQDIALFASEYEGIQINAQRNQGDIEVYVQDQVSKAAHGKRRKLLRTEALSREDLVRIEDTLTKGAQGMFRWVQLQLEYFYTLSLRSELFARLEKLPPELEKSYKMLYEAKMLELGDGQAAVVKSILSWLLVAKRQLKTFELRELVLSETGANITNETVLDMCFSLVSLDSEQDHFRFAHASAREFLETDLSDFSPPALHSRALGNCVDIITKGSYRVQNPAPDTELCYAPLYWPFHAEALQDLGVEFQPTHTQQDFLFCRSEAFAEWCRAMAAHVIPDWEITDQPEKRAARRVLQCIDGNSHPSILCASFGLYNQLREMLLHGNPEKIVRLTTRDGAHALYLASQQGHVDVVRLLLEHGADVNTGGTGTSRNLGNPENGDDQSHIALIAACTRGYEDIVKLLLQSGADVHVRTFPFRAPVLHVAAKRGYTGIVQLLLDNGADVHALGGLIPTDALENASSAGHLAIVQLLLEQGADPNPTNRNGRALLLASMHGHVEIMKLLLDRGANVDAKDDFGNTVLQEALRERSLEVVMLLLDYGARIRAEGDEYGTKTLAIAMEGGISNRPIVAALIAKGALDVPEAETEDQGIEERPDEPGIQGQDPEGEWAGHRTLVSELGERDEPIGITIAITGKRTEMDAIRFQGEGTDLIGDFIIEGQLGRHRRVRWFKLCPGSGTLYNGQLDEEEKTITGRWESGGAEVNGTFVLRKVEM